MKNIVDDAASGRIKKELREELRAWLAKAETPFVRNWFATMSPRMVRNWKREHDGAGIEAAFDLERCIGG